MVGNNIAADYSTRQFLREQQFATYSQRIMYAIDDEQKIINIISLVHVRQNLDSQESLPWSEH